MNHISYADTKPVKSGESSTPDGAVCGNGDLSVILGNAPSGLRIYISKNDIWYGAEEYRLGGLRPLGYIEIPMLGDMYSNFHSEMDMDKGEIRCRFSAMTNKLTFTIRVLKTVNAILIEKTGNMDFSPVLRAFAKSDAGRCGEFNEQGVRGVYRIFEGEECAYETHAYVAMKKVDPNTLIAYVATNHDVENPFASVIASIKETDWPAIEKYKEEHAKAWEEFWSKSRMTLSDEKLENGWYASQYICAICMDKTKFAPGIFGNFITVEHPSWHSDYHLNYNYQAQFYAAISSNHVELTDCYMTPLEEFMDRGREFAQKMGCRGIVYPVAIAPKGLCAEYVKDHPYAFERLFLGQRSTAIHAADIAVFRWNATHDLDFARNHAYPYLKEALTFFEDYGVYEKGRFLIKNDAAHEVPVYKDNFKPHRYPYLKDINNNVTTGMLRLCIPAAVEMAEALGLDNEDRDSIVAWKKMLSGLPPFPTMHRHGRKVFRYTLKGQDWNDTNDVGLQHIYPGCCIDFTSDKETYTIAVNTVNEKIRDGALEDDNAICSIYPMAARLKMDPAMITGGLRNLESKRRLKNMMFDNLAGGLEYPPTTANTLNTMAVGKYGDGLYIFPDWDSTIDCSYENLLTDGGFLVSAEMKGGKVTAATVKATLEADRITLNLPVDADKTSSWYTCRVNGKPVPATNGSTAFALNGIAQGDEITVERHNA